MLPHGRDRVGDGDARARDGGDADARERGVAPQQKRPSTGALWPGKARSPALKAGPKVPPSRRRNRSCVSGVPTLWTTARRRMSGMNRSTAFQSTSARASFFALYSAEARSRPAQSA